MNKLSLPLKGLLFPFLLSFAEYLYVSPVHQGDACDQFFPCSFQTALSRAESNGESDVVYVSPGTYLIGATLQVNITDRRSLTIKPLDPENMPILDGGGSTRIMSVFFAGTEITIEGLIFRNGSAQNEDGGALYIDAEANAALFVRNSFFSQQLSPQRGSYLHKFHSRKGLYLG